MDHIGLAGRQGAAAGEQAERLRALTGACGAARSRWTHPGLQFRQDGQLASTRWPTLRLIDSSDLTLLLVVLHAESVCAARVALASLIQPSISQPKASFIASHVSEQTTPGLVVEGRWATSGRPPVQFSSVQFRRIPWSPSAERSMEA